MVDQKNGNIFQDEEIEKMTLKDYGKHKDERIERNA